MPWFGPGHKPAGRHNRAGIPVIYRDGHGEVVPRNGIKSPGDTRHAVAVVVLPVPDAAQDLDVPGLRTGA
ncbi:MAG: hypothetical protein ACREIT_09160 [Tepidisphaeraceae bacterium]